MATIAEDPLVWFVELGKGLVKLHALQLLSGLFTLLIITFSRRSSLLFQLATSMFLNALLGFFSWTIFDPATHLAGCIAGGVSSWSILLKSAYWIQKNAFEYIDSDHHEILVSTAMPIAEVRKNSPAEKPLVQFMRGITFICFATLMCPSLLGPRTGLSYWTAEILLTTFATSGVFNLFAAYTGVVLRKRSPSPFRSPLLSQSVAEFWGNRWNAPIGDSLRGALYKPMTKYYKISPIIAVFATFVVSGFLHEGLLLYCGFSGSHGEWLLFFTVSGVFTIVEKKLAGRMLQWSSGAKFLTTFVLLFSSVHFLFFPVAFRLGFVQKGLATFSAGPALMRYFTI